MPTSITLGLFTDETYFLDDAQAQQRLAQYVHAIMRHGIGYNIVNIANQLPFAYWGLVSELRVFVLPPTKWTKTVDFIRMLEKKQEIRHKMMTILAGPQRYCNLSQRSSSYKILLPSQSEVFSCFQSQYHISLSQQPWQFSERISECGYNFGQSSPPTRL